MSTIRERTAQAYDAIRMTNIAEQNKLVRRLVRKTQDNTIGKPTIEPEDEPMSYVIGDTYDYSTKTTPATTSNVPWIVSALALALASSGLTLAVASMMSNEPKVEQQVVEPNDTDTITRIGFRE